MSIINDALKKTQEQRKLNRERRGQGNARSAAPADAPPTIVASAAKVAAASAASAAAINSSAAAASAAAAAAVSPAAIARHATQTTRARVPGQAYDPRRTAQAVAAHSDMSGPWRMAGYFVVIGLFVIMALASYKQFADQKHGVLPSIPAVNSTNNATNPTTTSSINNISILSKTPEKVRVAFDGVFFSDNTKIALINKQQLRLGDSINGMKIIAIDSDKIKLQDINGVIELQAGATYLI